MSLSARVSWRRTGAMPVLLALVGASAAVLAGDPMRPPFGAPARAAVAAPLQLQGIIGDGATRVAIVNGTLVHSGQQIGTSQIERILADRIEYRRNGRAFTALLSAPAANLHIWTSKPAESP
jgi:hypothetical protein